MSKAPCLRVPKALGEKAIGLARKLRLFDKELKVQLAGDRLHIPLIGSPSPAQIKELKDALPEAEVSIYAFPKRVKRPLRIIDVLADKLPPHLLASLPRSMDFIGEIAVVEVPPELEGHKKILGEAILATNKRLHTVLAKSSAVEGVYRVRKFEVVAGEGKTETIHKEYGCRFLLDVKEVYFSPRLSYERWRISKLVRPDEVVVNMFAGVGCFSVMIAKHAKPAKVYSIDINPVAMPYMKENLRLNKVENIVVPILGDASQIIRGQLRGVADRVVMQLPGRAYEFLDVAALALKSRGGILHYYSFIDENKIAVERVRVLKRLKELEYKGEIMFKRIIFPIAPRRYEIVFDINVTRA